MQNIFECNMLLRYVVILSQFGTLPGGFGHQSGVVGAFFRTLFAFLPQYRVSQCKLCVYVYVYEKERDKQGDGGNFFKNQRTWFGGLVLVCFLESVETLDNKSNEANAIICD